MTKKLNYIDLFAGAGGLSEGFTRAGYNPVAHVEKDSSACFTLKTRIAYHYLKNNKRLSEYYAYLKGETSRKELYEKIPQELLDSVIHASIGKDNKKIFKQIDTLKGRQKIDFIIGGPPCQAYSYIGRAALKNRIKTDERNFLYREYGKFLKKYKPKFFVFENVPGIKTAGNGRYYKNLRRYFKMLGYNLDDRLVNAYDFGVIQNRERLIIIGWKEKIKFKYPNFSKLNHTWNRDHIFEDLPSIKPGHADPLSYYSKKELNDYLLHTEIRNGVDFVTQHIT
ncbi:MAG TPA: DNA cytosine methyltransferase, partial [Chitinophagaceae bacterium]|nr:DNA cytosine methyltransferase [Chitinophagaceae bacterium]